MNRCDETARLEINPEDILVIHWSETVIVKEVYLDKSFLTKDNRIFSVHLKKKGERLQDAGEICVEGEAVDVVKRWDGKNERYVNSELLKQYIEEHSK